MTDPEILIIDDEPQIRKLLQITMESNGYKTVEASTAKMGLLTAAHHPPDMIILDLGLPDESGHHVLRKLREWYMNPIIILSVLQGEEDIVKALDNGANDYLIKPFRTGELLARIRSVLRNQASAESDPTILSDDLKIDLSARIVKKDSQILKLTSTEYDLLALLAKNQGKVLTHHYLLKEVWGPGYVSELQYLRVFIAQLRKKIEDDVNKPLHIVTESGIGYRFV